MAKKVRMSDIAERAGVSVVTVSKALSDQKGVSDEMKAKIIRIASELGYERHPERKGISQSYNIGVIVPEGYITKYQTFYWQLYQEINTSAAMHNSFVMLEIINVDDENGNVLPKLVSENKIDVLIPMGSFRTEYLKSLRERTRLSMVFLDFYDSEIQEDAVISNSFYGTFLITNYLIEKGVKRIAYVGTLLSTKSITDRYLGFRKALMEAGLELRDDWIIDDRHMNRESIYDIPLPKDMPEAFVCNCDVTAARLIDSLSKHGLKVPENVLVTGFDDFIHPGVCDVPLTTYAVNMEAMAESAVRNAIKKLNNIETNNGIHLIEGKLIIRRSA